ncbi:unnamed protein product [Brachionus calyciflorus]|uniref:Arginine kinase n=1 Tax=Brachionus calyciflorus TaxID=104777 RepID=A0A813YQ93_9BILA|nr:unnamed protein product [Brachionus calyciflorus]
MPDTKSSKIENKFDYWISDSVKDAPFEEQYEIISELSSGPFGTNLKCKPRGQNLFCCVKTISKNKNRKVSLKESSHLLKLNHPNVNRVKEIFESSDNIYIVSELLIGSEALERIVKRQPFTEREAVKILKQILEGLKYIHDEGLVHGNLKPENLVFENENDESNVKITDIALYPILESELLKHAIVSNVQFCAPEILRNEVGNPASDMWSLGAFSYLLLCGEEPFKAETDEELYKKIFKASYNTTASNYESLSANAKDFIMKLLTVDPQKRMTVYQALNNSWILGKATKNDSLNATLDSMRVIVNKKKTQAFLNKQALKSKNSKASLTQKYLPKDVWLWLQKTTKYGTTMVDCVKSAVENPNSSVGLYAPDPDCYDTFPEIFWPVISDYHKVDVYSLKSIHDFGNPNDLPDFDSKYADSIVSSRIRVGRTLDGFPMGPKLSRETREEIKDLMIESFRNLQGELYGDFFELSEMSYKERDSLIESHYLFADADDKYLKSAGGYSDWPLNRGIFMNRKKTFVVWLNEEDHVRIISIQQGSNIKQVYSRLVKGINIIEQKAKFAHHDKFGYLTFCPTNIGTGLRASVHVKLPKLGASGKLKQLCESLNLQPRGVHGENSESEGGVYDISNKVRIGKTEFDLVNSMCLGIKKLLDEEFAMK